MNILDILKNVYTIIIIIIIIERKIHTLVLHLSKSCTDFVINMI